MANKQTRRSVSLERLLYLATQERAASLEQSVSEYISKLIRADFQVAGIQCPGGRFASEFRIAKPPSKPLDVRIAVANVVAKKPTIDPKYATALEFTRRKLAEPSTSEPEPERSNECWWCGDRFKIGEIPSDHDGNRVHGKCKREIGRLPPDVKPYPAK